MQWETGVTPSQRNILTRILGESGLQPADFTWTATEFKVNNRRSVSVVIDSPTHGCRFTISFVEEPGKLAPTTYHIKFSAPRQRFATVPQDCHWQPVEKGFERWLDLIKNDIKERSTPDLWEALRSAPQLLPATMNDASEPFTIDEQQRLSLAIADIKAEIQTGFAQLTGDQKAGLQITLDAIDESTKRLSRIDWKNALLGAYMGWAMQHTLDSQVAQMVFDFMATKISAVFHAIPSLTA